MEFNEKTKFNGTLIDNEKKTASLLEEYARLKYDFFHNKLDSSMIPRYQELKRHFDVVKLNSVKEEIKKRLIDLNKTKTDDNAMYTAITNFKKINE